MKYPSELASFIVESGYRITFDLVVKVGRLRYDEYRQLGEIQNFLKCSFAKIDLPISTIGMIAKRFLEFCKLFHEKHEPLIRDDIACRGGYFLHFDGTTENKCGKCNLVVIDSISGHVLLSQFIAVESYDTIKKILENVEVKYGLPLATISDLKAGFLKACFEVFGKLVPHIFCHYHFLNTFRDDFMKYHTLVRNHLVRKVKLSSAIEREIVRLKKLEPELKLKRILSMKDIEKYWMNTGDVFGTYWYVLHWIGRYKQDSSGKGVPFDLPYLDFYNRFIQGEKIIKKIFDSAPPVYRLKYYKLGFSVIIALVKKGDEDTKIFRNTIRHLEYFKKWFVRLRSVLFLQGKEDEEDTMLAPLSKKYNLTEEEVKSIPPRLTDYIKKLDKEMDHCKNHYKKNIVKRLREQVEKYHKNLFVPIYSKKINGRSVTLIPARTNNCMESFFRSIKTLIRRCTGRSKLPKEFGSIGALLPYYLSMKNQKIFKPIFEDNKKLSEEFSKLFVKKGNIPENIIVLPEKTKNVQNCMQSNTFLSESNGILEQ